MISSDGGRSERAVSEQVTEEAPAQFRHSDRPKLERVVMPSGETGVAACGHADARMVMSDPRFKTDLSYPGAPRMFPGPNIRDNPNDLINMDPPRHSQLRRLVSQQFAPRKIAEWRPRITEITEELLDELIERGPPVDFVSDFAYPLPSRIVCEFLGVPQRDWKRFIELSHAWLSTADVPPEVRGAAMMQFKAYVEEFIEERRRNPGNALADFLINMRDDDGEALPADELPLLVVGFVAGGHDTIPSFMTKGLILLLSHRSQFERLAAEPESVPGAVEEILRYDIPSDNGLLRVATEDVELPSGMVRAGEAVLPVLSAADRDPDVFPEPHRFDISRTENAHVSFGYGRHLCLGAHMARLQLQVTLGTIARRLPTLRPAIPTEEIKFKSGLVVGVESLPVTW